MVWVGKVCIFVYQISRLIYNASATSSTISTPALFWSIILSEGLVVATHGQLAMLLMPDTPRTSSKTA